MMVADLDRSLVDLQRIAARSMPLGLRSTSPNGREYFSNYFQTVDRKFKPADTEKERHYAQVLVLGDRRPYNIQILVHRERKSSTAVSGYEEIGLDLGLARAVRKRILSQLNKRREELNVIDDFRVF